MHDKLLRRIYLAVVINIATNGCICTEIFGDSEMPGWRNAWLAKMKATRNNENSFEYDEKLRETARGDDERL